MTDLRSKIKVLNESLIEHLDTLDAQVEYLKDGLRLLLAEEDVRDIPSFDLLHSVYSEYLTTSPYNVKIKKNSTASKHSKEIAQQIYDPLYAPPAGRSRVNAASRKKFTESQQQNPKPVRDAPIKETISEDMSETTSAFTPDFSESMLDDMGTTQKKKAPLTAKASKAPVAPVAAAVLIVKPKVDECVYTVEIKNKTFLRLGKYLYHPETHLRVGVIENNCFNINAASSYSAFCVAIDEAVCMQAIEDTSYCQGDDNKVYLKIDDNIAQAVGEINENNEVGLWS
jgi:hypothetical protein